jgi:hypothetical protein
MNHHRTCLVMALCLAALTPVAQAHDQGSSKEDKCERITSKALCVNTVASDKVKYTWNLAFKDGVITAYSIPVGTYTCKGNHMFQAALSATGMDTVTILGEVTSKEGKLEGYGVEASEASYVFRLKGERCKRS